MLVSQIPELGDTVHFLLEDTTSLLDDCLKHLPSSINKNSLLKVFKNDFCIESIIEKITCCDIFYITNNAGPGEELYYFLGNDRLFHGDLCWSRYHGFLSHLLDVPVHLRLKQPCWFVGSRNNYTHQLLDFFPNYQVFSEILLPTPPRSLSFLSGQANEIAQALLNCKTANISDAHNFCNIRELTDSSSQIGSWTVTRIQCTELYLAKHLSIFKRFSLLSSLFTNYLPLPASARLTKPRIGYLRRSDQRISNQALIQSHLVRNWDAAIIDPLQSHSFKSKSEILSKFDVLIVPPGSENINAFLFARSDCKFVQLMSVSVQEMLSSPFTSYAGLRYQLPFLSRIAYVAGMRNSATDINSGIWSTESLDFALDDLCNN